MDQEIIATNVWNFSKYADISLVLEAKSSGAASGNENQNPDDTTSPDTGMNTVAPVVLCVAAVAACVALTKKKH